MAIVGNVYMNKAAKGINSGFHTSSILALGYLAITTYLLHMHLGRADGSGNYVIITDSFMEESEIE